MLVKPKYNLTLKMKSILFFLFAICFLTSSAQIRSSAPLVYQINSDYTYAKSVMLIKAIETIPLDTAVIRYAKMGIYIPTYVGQYYSDLDSLIEAKKQLLTNDQIKFMEFIEKKGVHKLSKRKQKKYSESIVNLLPDTNSMLCFHAIYDKELQARSKEQLIFKMKDGSTKVMTPDTDPDFFDYLKDTIGTLLVKNCEVPVGDYSFNLFNYGAIIYPKLSDRYQSNYATFSVMTILATYMVRNKEIESFVAGHIKASAPTTVPCPKPTNPFGGGGSGDGRGSGNGGNTDRPMRFGDGPGR